MRIIFMGSPDFAVPSLEALVAAGHEVVAAYAQPPRPAGRGKAERKTAVHERAEALGIPVRTPRTLRNEEEQAAFRSLDAELAVVAAYGLILPKAILEAPKGGCINVHASLLPRWRGAAPVQRAILAGDEITGVTIMRMDEGLDTGPMLLKRELDISGKNAGQVTEELARLGAKAVVEWLAHPTPPEPQPAVGVDLCVQGRQGRGADRLDQAGRGDSTSGAGLRAESRGVVRGERRADQAARSRRRAGFRFRGNDGMVVDDQLLIACGEDAIRPQLVQRAGRGPMSPDELLRGFAIPKGTILP